MLFTYGNKYRYDVIILLQQKMIVCVLSVFTKHNNGFIREMKKIQIMFPKKKLIFSVISVVLTSLVLSLIASIAEICVPNRFLICS